MAAASRRLRELQSLPGNKTCVDCPQRNPQWASISYGVFMCLECSGKHRGLGVHISFVRSVTMDSWSDPQIRKMESGGNDRLNSFLLLRGITKDVQISLKYNSRAAAIYRDRISALADGRIWTDPPLEMESTPTGCSAMSTMPPESGNWAHWDEDDFGDSSSGASGDFRRHRSARDSASLRSKDDIHLRSLLGASSVDKDGFFTRKVEENRRRPEGIPPAHGGKYVGFGSSPVPTERQWCASHGGVIRDTMSVVSQGLGRLSGAAASTAQSAANIVQVGTKEFTSKVLRCIRCQSLLTNIHLS